MADLYNVLLKNTENISFGASPMSIIAPRKGEVVVKVKKLVVTYDGELYDPVDCQSVTVKFEDDTIILDVILTKTKEQSVTEDIPQVEAVIPPSTTDTFMLQGDDLESFELLSEFHRPENQISKTENDSLEAYTIESGIFNIQDLPSVQNAVLDVTEKEKQFIDSGYKVFKTNTPRFNYTEGDNFKLVESVVLIKQVATTDVVEESK